MKNKSLPIITFLAAAVIAGCNEENKKSVEEVKTVDYYMTNKDEMKEVLKKCNNNPGELALTPNCINAGKADNKLVWSSRGGIKVKPLTAEELGFGTKKPAKEKP